MKKSVFVFLFFALHGGVLADTLDAGSGIVAGSPMLTSSVLVRVVPSPILAKHDFVNEVSLRLSGDDLSLPDSVIENLEKIATILKRCPRAAIRVSFFQGDSKMSSRLERIGFSSESIFYYLVSSVHRLHKIGKLDSKLPDILNDWGKLSSDPTPTVLDLEWIIRSHMDICVTN